MWLAILGPVGVITESRFVSISRPYVRGVLVTLTLNAGKLVSYRTLTDSLWDIAPASADANLRKFVMHLRHELASIHPDLADRIRTYGRQGGGGGGYSLQADWSEIDYGRFEADRANGRKAMLDGEAVEAMDLLTRAIGWWRGPAGLDVPGDGALAPRLGQIDLRLLGAREQLGAALLVVGDVASAIHQAEIVLVREPTRERAAGLLLLAHYRRGDIHAAIDVYTKVRAALAEEYGLDPTGLLEKLHLALLNRDHHVLGSSQMVIDLVESDGAGRQPNPARPSI